MTDDDFDDRIHSAATVVPAKPLPVRTKPRRVISSPPIGAPTAVENPLERLDPRERKFVELYCQTSKVGQSALVAGYASTIKAAGVQGSRLLARASIRNAVNYRNAQLMIELDFGPQRIVRRFAEIANREPAEIRGADVLKALEHLAKISGLFPQDRQYLSIDGTVTHQHTVAVEQLDTDDREKLRDVLTALKARQIEHDDEEPK